MNEHDPETDAPQLSASAAAETATPAPHKLAPVSPPFAFATPRVLAGIGINAAIAVAAAFTAGVVALVIVVILVAQLSQSEAAFAATDAIPIDAGAVISLVAMLAGYSLGGEITLDVFGAGQATTVLLPLTLVMGIALAASWWGFRAERAAPLASTIERVIAGVGTGVVAAGLLTGVAALGTLRSSSAGLSIVVSSAGWRVFLTGLVVIAASALLGRVLAAHSSAPRYFSAFAPAVRRAAPILREPVGYAAIVGIAFAPVVIVVAVVSIVQAGAPLASLLSMLLYGINATLSTSAVAHLGSMQFDATVAALGSSQGSSAAYWAFSPEFGGWGVLLIIVAFAVTAYAALWIGLRRQRMQRPVWTRVWQLPLVVLIAWVIVALFAMHGTLDASGTIGFISGTVHGGIDVTWWTPLLLAIWAGLVSVGAEYAPDLAYALAPTAVSGVAGRRAFEGWLRGAPTSSPADAAAVVPTSVDHAPAGQSLVDATDAAAAPQPMDPARRRRVLIGAAVVGGVILLAIAGVSTLGAVNASRSPQAHVAEYVGHIAAGEAALASKAVDPNVPSDERDLLTDVALKGATQRIADVRTTLVSTEGDTATVGVTYRLDGVDEYAELRAERGPNEFGVLETWRVIDPLVGEVEIFTDVYDVLALGGVDVAVGDGDATPSQIVYVYPGVYEVSAPESEYYTASPTTVRAAGSAGSSLALAEVLGEPTEALMAEISTQVNALIDECVTSTEAAPEGCPLYTWATRDAPVTWTVVEYPELEMLGATSFQTVGGEVTYAYTYSSFGTEYSQDGSDEPSVYGEVTLEDGEPVVTFAE